MDAVIVVALISGVAAVAMGVMTLRRQARYRREMHERMDAIRARVVADARDAHERRQATRPSYDESLTGH